MYESSIDTLVDSTRRIAGWIELMQCAEQMLPDDPEEIEVVVKEFTTRVREKQLAAPRVQPEQTPGVPSHPCTITIDEESRALEAVIFAVPGKLAPAGTTDFDPHILPIFDWVQECFPSEAVEELEAHYHLNQFQIAARVSHDAWIFCLLRMTMCDLFRYYFDDE